MIKYQKIIEKRNQYRKAINKEQKQQNEYKINE